MKLTETFWMMLRNAQCWSYCQPRLFERGNEDGSNFL